MKRLRIQGHGEEGWGSRGSKTCCRRGVTRSDAQVVVPNGQIMGVPLVNFSRMRWGQYKTELRLRLEDVSRVEATIANLKAALEPHVITTGRNLWVHWWCAVPVPLSRRVVEVIRAQAAHRQGRARRRRRRQTAVPGRLDGVLRRRAFPGGDSARLDAIDA